MNRSQFLLQIVILAQALVLATDLQAQTPSHSIDPAVSEIAARIAQPLQESHAKKVIVADLTGPDGQPHPVGKWLADQLSESLARNFPALKVIARPADQAISKNAHVTDSPSAAQQSAKDWAHHLGAKVVVTGSFARTANGIAISLAASHPSGSAYILGEATGIVPITDEITSLSPEPIPAQGSGSPRAGVGGYSVPVCIDCPPPELTHEARAAKAQGAVVLQVTITTDGRATNISVRKSPGVALAASAVKAVSTWRFKPAIGPDGKPAAVICPIEVTFRF
ncbi:MAG: energy transducer TonB [Candidatus Acidiferrum sp.]